jgi:hypothetical protein
MQENHMLENETFDIYSSPPLIPPSAMKNGLRGVASLKGGNLVVFYNFCASEI